MKIYRKQTKLQTNNPTINYAALNVEDNEEREKKYPEKNSLEKEYYEFKKMAMPNPQK